MAVFGEAEAIPAAPFDGAMIKNHVVAAGEVDGAFALVAGDALAETQVADDDVMAAAEGGGTAVEHDAVAGRSLAGQGEMIIHRDIGFQPDDAADVKDHEAVGPADGVAKRAGAGIGQRGDVNDLAGIAAGGELAETFGPGKCEGRGGLRQRRGQAQTEQDGNQGVDFHVP